MALFYLALMKIPFVNSLGSVSLIMLKQSNKEKRIVSILEILARFARKKSRSLEKIQGASEFWLTYSGITKHRTGAIASCVLFSRQKI